MAPAAFALRRFPARCQIALGKPPLRSPAAAFASNKIKSRNQQAEKQLNLRTPQKKSILKRDIAAKSLFQATKSVRKATKPCWKAATARWKAPMSVRKGAKTGWKAPMSLSEAPKSRWKAMMSVRKETKAVRKKATSRCDVAMSVKKEKKFVSPAVLSLRRTCAR